VPKPGSCGKLVLIGICAKKCGKIIKYLIREKASHVDAKNGVMIYEMLLLKCNEICML
jgi:hypothetical protein